MFALGLLVALFGGLLGCAEAPPNTDGGVDGGGVDGGADTGLAVTPPDIPWLEDGVPPLMLTPCPEGWHEAVVNGVAECDPYPEAGPATCEAGEAHFPGEAGCRPIGAPCPAGDYAEELPTDGSVIYINASAAAGGDGSLAAPYAGLREVRWTWLSPGATLALAKGTYEGSLQPKGGVRIVGACARETRVTGDPGSGQGAVTVLNGVGAAMVESLTIDHPPSFGVFLDAGNTITLDGVLIDGAHDVGILAFDAGTEVTLRDTVVQNTRPATSGGSLGRGIWVEDGPRLVATRVLVDGNAGVGLGVSGTESTGSLTDTVVRNTHPRASDGEFGLGIKVQLGGHLEATRLLLEGNHSQGLSTYNVGSRTTLTDAIIRDTQPEVSGEGGAGIAVGEEAQFTATRLLVTGNQSVGMYLDGVRTTASLTDTVVRDTSPEAVNDKFGRGISMRAGAVLTATRLLVAQNHDIGIFASGEESRLTLTDAVVQGTAPQAMTGISGRGLNVEHGAGLHGTRLLVTQNHDIGIFVADLTSTVILADAVIRQTAAQESDGTGGRGLNAQWRGHIEGHRVRVEESSEFAVLSIGDSLIELTDVSILGVAQAACAQSTCPDAVHGHGATAEGAALRLTRFEIRDVETCGAFLSQEPGTTVPVNLDLTEGVVSTSTIGACVQVDGFDFDRLQNDVEYRDNAANLNSTSLPVPQAAASAGI